jgi:hypothetical protein
VGRCASCVRRNDTAGGTNVFTIALTLGFVAASMAVAGARAIVQTVLLILR